MEVIIIGGIAAGMSTAAKAKRVNPDANITVIEMEDFISFGACGLPYYLGGQFTDPNNMFARTPEQIEKSGINLLLQHKAEAVDFDAKEVTVKNLQTNETFTKSYDRLMIASGATPNIPPVEGMDAENVYTFTKLAAVEDLKANMDNRNEFVIVGGGFIGIEVAEQLAHLGKKVHLIQAGDRLIEGPFDPEFSEKIKEALEEFGVKIYLNTMFESVVVEDNKVVSVKTSVGEISTDALIMAIGFRPNTAFLTDERLEKLANGAIVVDSFGRTSMPDVFSAGDCATVPHRQLGNIYLPLATTANKLGRIIGTNIVVDEPAYEEFLGTLGSSSIKAGNFEAGSTGLTETMAAGQGLNFKTTTVQTNNHTDYWPGQIQITIKLVYEADTKVLLGAQVFGASDAVLRLTGLTTAVYAGLTTPELGFVDFAYSPPFASTWEAINVAANTAK